MGVITANSEKLSDAREALDKAGEHLKQAANLMSEVLQSDVQDYSSDYLQTIITEKHSIELFTLNHITEKEF